MRSKSTLKTWSSLGATLGLALVLSGCAITQPTFTATVTTLSEPLPEIPVRGVYQFAEVPPAESGSLEYRTVRDAVRIGLTHVGLSPVSATSGPANVVVSFQYTAVPFQTWTDAPIIPPMAPMMPPYPPPYPPFGPYGGPYPYGGFYGPGPGWGVGVMMTPGYQPVPVEEWRQTLEISIRNNNNAGLEVYRVKAVHESPQDNRYDILPLMVEAALQGYPNGGNSTRTVRIPLAR